MLVKCSGVFLKEILKFRKKYVKKGGLAILLNIIIKFNTDENVTEACSCIISAILSSQEAYSKFIVPEAENIIKEFSEKHKDSKVFKQ